MLYSDVLTELQVCCAIAIVVLLDPILHCNSLFFLLHFLFDAFQTHPRFDAYYWRDMIIRSWV